MGQVPQDLGFDFASLEIVPLEDEALAVSAEAGVIVHLNSVGRQVLESFATGLSIDELAQAMAAGYGISQAQARSDLISFRDDLEQSVYDARNQVPLQRANQPTLSKPVTVASYEIFGRVICIRYPDQETAAVCHPPLAPFECEPGADGGLEVEISKTTDEIHVRCGRATVTIPNLPGALMTALQRAMLCHDVENPCLFGVVVHAGAVVGPNGAWLIGGSSGRGKSTLVARLDAAGYRVLSDDLVPIDLATGCAYPMPIALSLKEKGWPAVSTFRADLVSAPTYTSAVGKRVKYLRPLHPPLDGDRSGHPIAGVLLPQFTAGGGAARVKTIGLKRSILGLCDRFGRFPVEPADLKQLIARLNHLPCYELTYGDGEEIVALVSDFL